VRAGIAGADSAQACASAPVWPYRVSMARLLLFLISAVAVVFLLLAVVHVLFFAFWIFLLAVVAFAVVGVFRLGRRSARGRHR